MNKPLDSFQYENGFYATAQARRMGRLLSHYELYKKTIDLDGEIIECGVFKGASFHRFVMFSQLFDPEAKKKVIGFDTYGDFPGTNHPGDKAELDLFIKETGGGQSISIEKLKEELNEKNFKNFDLVKGDICKTVPQFVKDNPNLKISLLNIDTDIYEPAKTIVDYLAPLVVKGGIIIFDDYGVFPGETEIADEYCKNFKQKIRNFPYCNVPSYIVKE